MLNIPILSYNKTIETDMSFPDPPNKLGYNTADAPERSKFTHLTA